MDARMNVPARGAERAMTTAGRQALLDTAAGRVVFHNGLWGGPAGYLWRGTDGAAAGRLPQWESEQLDLLVQRRLVTVRPGPTGRLDVAVVPTRAGLAALGLENPRAA
ncbi:hypothetical protein [Actinokineospora sp.]|uniref:hypothetical protein n=1 Tax=Actinokineospora sp. TaxID=1872133 RepID=UPI004037DE3D